jgi:hypothetical protein
MGNLRVRIQHPEDARGIAGDAVAAAGEPRTGAAASGTVALALPLQIDPI